MIVPTIYSDTPQGTLLLLQEHVDKLNAEMETAGLSRKLDILKTLIFAKSIHEYALEQISLGATKIAIDFPLLAVFMLTPEKDYFKFSTHTFNQKVHLYKLSEVDVRDQESFSSKEKFFENSPEN